MRWLVICAVALITLAQAQEIEDLGVVSQRRGMVLEKDTNQVDFLHFEIDLVALRWPSNNVTFVTTNEILTLQDFMPMPPGPCVVGVRSVYSDGDKSTTMLYRVRVRRDSPKGPRMHPTAIGTGAPIYNQSTTNILHERRRRMLNQQSAAMPPMPPGVVPVRVQRSQADLTREMVRSMAMAEESIQSLTNVTAVSVTAVPGPLPGGSPKTYSDHMVEMHDFYSRQGRRRSE